MNDCSMVIIGAGMAGLATGCYAQMNGYRTQIFELHSQPGGLCTSWRRKGYTFDGCIHWLVGAGPGSGLHHVWRELGAVQGRDFVYHEEFVQIEGPDGRALTVYTDIDRLEQHLKTLAPADVELIEEYTRAARLFTRIDLFALPALPPARLLKLLPYAGALLQWGRVSMHDFAARFTDPFLRQVFPLIHNHPALPMAAHLANLAAWHSHHAGWPRGGSLEFARAIERRYRELGGEVHYRSRVDKILVDTRSASHRAVGVRLAGGEEYRAGTVVSAADGYSTLFRMLGGEYTTGAIRAYYAAPPERQEHGILVALGVDRDLSGAPHAVTYLLDQPVTLAGEARQRLTVEHYGFDPALAPPGKSVVQVWLDSGHAYWQDLSAQRPRYEAHKRKVAGQVIAHLEQHYPGIGEQIEVVDVATPLTIERYTGAWRGAEAWFPPSNRLAVMIKGLSRTLPGLEGFYMVGQWAGAAGGLPMAATASRKLVQSLCRRDRRRFVTTRPASVRAASLCAVRPPAGR